MESNLHSGEEYNSPSIQIEIIRKRIKVFQPMSANTLLLLGMFHTATSDGINHFMKILYLFYISFGG